MSKVTVLVCNSCGTWWTEENLPETEALYECGNCGSVFSKSNGEGKGNRCPDCGKFAAKSDLPACPDCEMGGLEEEQAYVCEECEEMFPEEKDYVAHMKEVHDEE